MAPISVPAYLAGVAWLVVVLGACAATGVLLVARRPDLELPFRALGAATLAVAALVVVHLVPGALGVLGRGTVLLTALAMLALVSFWYLQRGPNGPAAGTRTGPGTGRRTDQAESWVDWVPAIVAVVAVVGFAIFFLDARRTAAIDEVDSLMFHLPQVARWIQTHRFWQLDDFAPGWAFGDYPNTGNVLQLAAVLPWRDDAFVRLVNLPLLILAGGGVATAAWELGARRSTAVLTGAVAMAVPVMLNVSVNGANTDTIAYAGFAVAAAFLVRFDRSGRRADLAYAGVGLGLAFGSKWYGVSSAAVLVALWVLWRLVRHGWRTWRALGIDTLVLGAGSVVLGGFWLLRNLVLSDNPLFPVRVALGGWVLFDAPYDHMRAVLGFAISHYLGDPTVLRRFMWLGFRQSFGWPAALALVGTIVAGAFAVRRRVPIVLALGVAAIALFLVYVVTPYTAMGPDGRPYLLGAATRYAGPALVLAVPAGGWALSIARPAWRRVLEWVTVLVVLDGVRRAADLLHVGIGDIVTARRVAGALAVAAAVATVVVVRTHRPRLANALAGAGVVAVLAGALVAGHLVQDRYRIHRYAGVDPVYDALLGGAPAGHTIALAGTYGGVNPPPLILHGYRFGNRVVYIGPRVDGRLEEYRDGPAFQRALRRSGADFLVVALGSPPRADVTHDEERWAQAAGWRPLVRSGRLALLAR